MTPNPRVLHVGKFYPPVSGGMEKVVQVLCEGERDTVQSEVLVANVAPTTVQESLNGVRVTRVAALNKIGAVAVCPTFPLWMRKLQSDVMVIHEPNPVALVAHAIAQPRSRLIFWVHAEVVRPQWRYNVFYRPFLRRVLRRAERIIVASPPIAEFAAELQPFRHKCVVVPYAIDPDQHALNEPRRARVAAIKAERRELLVLFVGRMVPYKGVDVLLRALVGTHARAVLVGDGPRREEWAQLATALGVAERVRFAGEASTEELAALYHACDVFVLPSVTRAEAFGMVQLEAMACRKPVISTNIPASGVPWVNQDGVTGIVVPPNDPDAMRNAIERLVADGALRERLGNAGRGHVLKRFTVKRLVEQTAEIYRGQPGVPIGESGESLPESAGAL